MVRLVGFNSCIFFFSTFGCAFYQAWSIKGEKRCDWGPFGRWATCGVHQRAIRMMRRDERLQKPGRPHSVTHTHTHNIKCVRLEWQCREWNDIQFIGITTYIQSCRGAHKIDGCAVWLGLDVTGLRRTARTNRLIRVYMWTCGTLACLDCLFKIRSF